MILYYIILYYIILYDMILYDIILYYIILYDIILYYIILYYIILYYIICYIYRVTHDAICTQFQAFHFQPILFFFATLRPPLLLARFTILEEGPAGLDILASNLSKVPISQGWFKWFIGIRWDARAPGVFRVGDEIHGNPTRLCRELFFFWRLKWSGVIKWSGFGGIKLDAGIYGNLCIFEGFTVW